MVLKDKYWAHLQQIKFTQKKKQEQLEIGKIKFTVKPIYFNKQIIHTSFLVNFTPNKPTQVQDNNGEKFYLKLILFILCTLYIFSLSVPLLSETSFETQDLIFPILFADTDLIVCRALTDTSSIL